MTRLKSLCIRSALALWLCAAGELAYADSVGVLSITTAGVTANGASDHPSISADGRYVVFDSDASNLVSGDTNGLKDIFLVDRQSGSIVRISVGASGQEANGASSNPSISASGRHIAFVTTANNLISSETGSQSRVLVYDRATATLTRVSVNNSGTQVAGNSYRPVLSWDGRYVAFSSMATDLVGGDTNMVLDVFVHDRDPDANGSFEGNGTTERVSLDTGATQRSIASDYPSISADGRYVAYASGMEVYVFDRNTDTSERVSVGLSGAASNGVSTYTSMSADARYVAFVSQATNLVSSDTNAAVADVFVADRNTGTIIIGSRSNSGVQVNVASSYPVLSADARYLGFLAASTAFATREISAPVYIDAVSSATGGGGGSGETTVTHAYRRDLVSGTTVRVSASAGGTAASASTGSLALDSDGTYVVFGSTAANIVCTTDSNSLSDVFIRDYSGTSSCGGSSSTSSSAGKGGMGPLILLALLVLWVRARRALKFQ